MKSKLIIAIFVIVLLIVVVTAVVYEPKCSIRDDPFSMHKVKVKIGEEYINYQEKLLCIRKGYFGWKWEKIALKPKIEIYAYNSTAPDFESAYPKINAQVYIGDFLYGVMKDGEYESENFDFPYCSWNNEKQLGECWFNLTIKNNDFVCEQEIQDVNYVQIYHIDINKCRKV